MHQRTNTAIALGDPRGVEQVELAKPLESVREAGGTPELISLEAGAVQMFNHLERGDTIEAEKAVCDADPSAYAGLVVPGGVANPDALRADEDACVADKPTAVICHGSWVLIEADVARGGTVTSWPGLRTES